ncbi:MAG: YiiX/YebB-like N1pC/P60 family cysteine hydrolase [Catalinimonas sp.]
MKATLCLFLFVMMGPVFGQGFRLQPGDLLFQDLDCGPLCDAIEAVTEGTEGADFSHVGIVSRVEGDRVWITEAVAAGVVRTPLANFLRRSADASGRPKVVVGRLKAAHRARIPDALAQLRHYEGRPYDRVYRMDDSTYYCSELVQEVFGLFTVQPMTFLDPATGRTFPAWVDYYEALGVPIPEGAPGLNPGGVSRSDALDIVHAYGRPYGWRGHLTTP